VTVRTKVDATVASILTDSIEAHTNTYRCQNDSRENLSKIRIYLSIIRHRSKMMTFERSNHCGEGLLCCAIKKLTDSLDLKIFIDAKT
jgi:hypothetical protein